jgi:hypothetical protein
VTIPIRTHSPLLEMFDFTTATVTNGVFALPSWLAIACATTGRTIQTSATTVRTGLGANAARARSVDGVAFGLSVEASLVNHVASLDTISAIWAFANSAALGAGTLAGPDGSTAHELTWTTANFSVGAPAAAGFSVVGAGLPARASIWAQGDVSTSIQSYDSASAAWTTTLAISASAWSRIDSGIASGGGSGSFSAWGDASFSLAGKAFLWGPQLEQRLYPSSYMPSPSGGATRAADVLSIPSPTLVAPGGFFDMTLTVAPNYSQAEQGADHDLLFFDSNNRVFIQQSTHKIVLRIGGVDVLSSALAWSREQGLTVRAAHQASGRTLTVSGATSGNGTATGASAAAITLPATAYMLGNASGAEECADLRSVGFSA